MILKIGSLPAAAAVIVLALFFLTGDEPEKKNVLLITLDTVRADRLSCYGANGITTPAIDRIAGMGVLFEQAVAPAPLTLPSHATVLTGLYPQSHGVRDNHSFRLSNRAVTLTEILRNNGYRTAAVVGSFILDSSFGLAQGFEYYDDEMVSSRVAGGLQRLTPRPASDVTSSSLSWLSRVSGEPFFLWVHYYDPHHPYEPPPPYADLYREDPYNGEIAFVDENVGRILQVLEAEKLLEETFIVVAGDHGEGLGDHGEKTHSVFVYEPMIRVPFIISRPRSLPAGVRIEEPVSLADIFPTILDLLDLDYEADLDGMSLVPLLRDGEKRDRFLYSESMFSSLTYGWSELSSLRGPRWKYIRSATPELYDLSRDPAEENNLAEARPDVLERFEARLDSLLEESPSGESFSDRRSSTPEERERLAALGYVTGSPGREEGTRPRDPKDMIRYHLLIDRGNKATDHARYDEAFDAFSEVLSLASKEERDPSMDELLGMVHNRLGFIAINQDDTTEALVQFGKAAEYDPDLLDVHFNLGNLYLMTQQFRQAAASFERAIEIDPRHAPSHAQLASVYLRTGDTIRAQKLLGRARMLEDTSDSPW